MTKFQIEYANIRSKKLLIVASCHKQESEHRDRINIKLSISEKGNFFDILKAFVLGNSSVNAEMGH